MRELNSVEIGLVGGGAATSCFTDRKAAKLAARAAKREAKKLAKAEKKAARQAAKNPVADDC